MAMASLLHHHHHHLHHQFRELSRSSIPPPPPALQIICCSSSSSKKKKAAHKRKPIFVKHRKHPHLPHTSTDDILLGVGAGATTLTALQPRQDPELPSQLQIVLERLSTLPDFGPLASPCQPPQSPSASHVTQLADFALPEPVGGFERRHRALESEEAEGDEGEYMVDETEWSEEEEDQRVECWEGDMEPMTEEEEAELLREAEKEIAELEKNRIALQGMEVGGDLRAGLDADESIFYPASVGGLEYSSSDWEWDELAAPGSSTQSRDSVGRIGWRELREEGLSPVRNENLPEVNVPTRATDVFMAEEMTKEWELEGQGGENDTLIQGPAEEYQTEFPEAGWEEGIDEGEEKSRRSIPAVMRCFDRAKIYVKAGDGGNGVVAFRREKHVPYGGPSGGSGGRGGNVYIEAVSSMNSLLPFRKSVHYRAGRGSHGQGKSQDGAAGQDCTVKVPPGTVVREAGQDLTESGAVLVELTRPGQCELLLPGGRGGRGNAAFKTGRNKAPQLAENGEEGAEMWLELELKLVADVGIIGVPNAGKSTLLSAISAAKPAIGDYPFTTLLPNLGVVSIGYDASMVVADLPGLLEGAHLGIGLGHEFLRHTERCRVLVHVVDGMSPQPEYEYEAVRLELQLFNPALASKPNIVAFNKKDIPEAAERWKKFQASLQQKGIEPICMSAATKSGTSEVVHKAYELLKYELTTDNALEIEDRSFQVGDMVRKQRSAPVEEFEIFCNTHTRTWQVQGVGLERFTQMTNWEYFEAFKRFQHVLISSGVNQALKERGVKEGDTVIVGQMEFNWHDSEDFSAAGDWKRGSRGSRLWPH